MRERFAILAQRAKKICRKEQIGVVVSSVSYVSSCAVVSYLVFTVNVIRKGSRGWYSAKLSKRNGTRAFYLEIFNVASFSKAQVATVLSFGKDDLVVYD